MVDAYGFSWIFHIYVSFLEGVQYLYIYTYVIYEEQLIDNLQPAAIWIYYCQSIGLRENLWETMVLTEPLKS
jgi:hypothetical protein